MASVLLLNQLAFFNMTEAYYVDNNYNKDTRYGTPEAADIAGGNLSYTDATVTSMNLNWWAMPPWGANAFGTYMEAHGHFDETGDMACFQHTSNYVQYAYGPTYCVSPGSGLLGMPNGYGDAAVEYVVLSISSTTEPATETSTEVSSDVATDVTTTDASATDVPLPTDPISTDDLIPTDPISTDIPIPTDIPIVTDPIVTDPIVTDPIVTDSIVTDTIVTDPIVTDSIVTEPITTDSVIPTDAPVSTDTPVTSDTGVISSDAGASTDAGVSTDSPVPTSDTGAVSSDADAGSTSTDAAVGPIETSSDAVGVPTSDTTPTTPVNTASILPPVLPLPQVPLPLSFCPLIS